MDVRVVNDQPWDVAADVLVIPIIGEPAFEGPLDELDRRTGGEIRALLAFGELRAKRWTSSVVSAGDLLANNAYRVDSLARLRITELGYAMPLQLWVQAAAQKMKIVEFPVPLIYLEEERSFGGSLDDARQRMAYYQEVIRKEMALQHLDCGCPGA